MPIRINLLAEAIAAEDLRRRDPVKRAIYGGAFFVALALVWFSSAWLEFMVDKQNLNRIEGSIQMHSNDWAQVQSNLKKIGDVQRRIDSLSELTTARFLQGNLLNGLQQTYVPNVQLTRVRVDQGYTTIAPIAPKVTGSVTSPGRPGSVTEHVNLTLDARDSSPNPGDQVNRFKDAILKNEYFASSLDLTNSIRLVGESPIQTPNEGKPYVMFTLECHFLDRTP